mmetsp:Transcript_7799/g.7044  ORF Transcript_7799/g.7044 Transcript_7799/m.7044 type:complete len:140 (-) Transcript_7799:1185-1604(-)
MIPAITHNMGQRGSTFTHRKESDSKSYVPSDKGYTRCVLCRHFKKTQQTFINSRCNHAFCDGCLLDIDFGKIKTKICFAKNCFNTVDLVHLGDFCLQSDPLSDWYQDLILYFENPLDYFEKKSGQKKKSKSNSPKESNG